MRMLGEMAAARPAVGSFMEYGPGGLGDWAAYFVGWLYWYSGGRDRLRGRGAVHPNGWVPGVPQWVFSILLLLVFTGANLVSLRSSVRPSSGWPASRWPRSWSSSWSASCFAFVCAERALLTLPNLWEHGGFMPKGIDAVVGGVAIVIFSYFGTEIAVMAASYRRTRPGRPAGHQHRHLAHPESSSSERSSLIVTIVPWNQLPDPKEKAPFAYLFSLYGLPGADVVNERRDLTAVCSVLNFRLYSAARMFSSIAEQGYAPKADRTEVLVRRARGRRHHRLYTGWLRAVIINFTAPDSGIFDFIKNSAGLVALFVLAFIALTQQRTRAATEPEEESQLKPRCGCTVARDPGESWRCSASWWSCCSPASPVRRRSGRLSSPSRSWPCAGRSCAKRSRPAAPPGSRSNGVPAEIPGH